MQLGQQQVGGAFVSVLFEGARRGLQVAQQIRLYGGRAALEDQMVVAGEVDHQRLRLERIDHDGDFGHAVFAADHHRMRTHGQSQPELAITGIAKRLGQAARHHANL